jgi:hypothetical protein
MASHSLPSSGIIQTMKHGENAVVDPSKECEAFEKTSYLFRQQVEEVALAVSHVISSLMLEDDKEESAVLATKDGANFGTFSDVVEVSGYRKGFPHAACCITPMIVLTHYPLSRMENTWNIFIATKPEI